MSSDNETTVLDIGSRLELFVDRYLIDRLEGAELKLHSPTPREVAFQFDAPWEGQSSTYVTVIKDSDRYRTYYRGSRLGRDGVGEVTCYAESKDGVHWVRPEMGLVELDGAKKNNIILNSADSPFPVGNFMPFKDANPDAAPDARYKAWARGADPLGLYPLKSPDGIHWTPMTDGPVITYGLLDSPNLAFWDPVRGEYRDYGMVQNGPKSA